MEILIALGKFLGLRLHEDTHTPGYIVLFSSEMCISFLVTIPFAFAEVSKLIYSVDAVWIVFVNLFSPLISTSFYSNVIINPFVPEIQFLEFP